MTDEIALRRQIVRAGRAKSLLDDETLSAAFDGVETDLLAVWKASALGETETREAAYRQFAALQEVKAKLRRFVGDGKAAETMLERLKSAVKSALA